ncbi:unnamed protein product [Allacma fusca]|uniref:Uncharacterized protein n=1 Tax=Allacma fusca TaxID=39272 RepID=A0A8J2NX71_9HEXA|nr:unnamed protein product [Allacma fusca]
MHVKKNWISVGLNVKICPEPSHTFDRKSIDFKTKFQSSQSLNYQDIRLCQSHSNRRGNPGGIVRELAMLERCRCYYSFARFGTYSSKHFFSGSNVQIPCWIKIILYVQIRNSVSKLRKIKIITKSLTLLGREDVQWNHFNEILSFQSPDFRPQIKFKVTGAIVLKNHFLAKKIMKQSPSTENGTAYTEQFHDKDTGAYTHGNKRKSLNEHVSMPQMSLEIVNKQEVPI